MTTLDLPDFRLRRQTVGAFTGALIIEWKATGVVEYIGDNSTGQMIRIVRALADRLTETNVDALLDVAHAAWHLLDDSGELDTTDDNGRRDYMHVGLHHDRLSGALDALEATGWDAHPEPITTPTGSTAPPTEGEQR